MKKETHGWLPAVRYWLAWILLVAGLAYGIHRYFEYRNEELDKRIEQLNKIPTNHF